MVGLRRRGACGFSSCARRTSGAEKGSTELPTEAERAARGAPIAGAAHDINARKSCEHRILHRREIGHSVLRIINSIRISAVR